MKKIKLLLYYICILLCLFMTNVYSSNENIDDDLDEFSKSVEFGNLYDYAHNLTVNTESQSTQEGFSAVSEHINAKRSCDTDKSDIYNVYLNMTKGEMFQAWTKLNSKEEEKESTSEKFQKSCMKIVKCLNTPVYTETDKATPSEDANIQFSETAYYSCREIVEQTLDSVKPNISETNSAKQINYGDEVFTNGKKDDASYDLLKDIEAIGKVIFKEMKDAPKVKFYDKSSSGSSSSSNSKLSLSNTHSITTSSSNTKLSSLYSNSSSSSIDTKTSNSSTNLSSSNSTIINNTTCQVIGTGESLTYGDNPEISTKYQTDETYYDYEGFYDGSGESISTLNDYYDNNIRSAVFDTASSDGDSSTKLMDMSSIFGGSSLSSSSSTEFDLGGGGPGCANVGDSDSIVDIKICMVDSNKGGVNAGGGGSSGGGSSSSSAGGGSQGKESIEEILEKILEEMREKKKKGARMKHSYTDEWWETSLKDIKLSEIFDFDFVVKSKPLFDNKSKDKKKEEDEKQEKEKNQDYEKRFLNSQEEKTRADLNKYIVIGEEKNTTLSSLAVDWDTWDNASDFAGTVEKELTPDNSGTENKEEKKTQYEFLKEYKSFLEANGKFWLGMQEGMKYVNGISETMKERVNAGAE